MATTNLLFPVSGVQRQLLLNFDYNCRSLFRDESEKRKPWDRLSPPVRLYTDPSDKFIFLDKIPPGSTYIPKY